MFAVFLVGPLGLGVLLLFAWYKMEPKPTKENSLISLLGRQEAMELIVVTALCIGLSILLTPCASLQTQLQPWLGQAHDYQISLRPQDAYDLQQHSFSKMPRKLRLIQMQRKEEKDSMSQYYKQKRNLSGKQDDKEAGPRGGRGGTMKEWMEGRDTSQFFTMDYTHVRRRRPIHNKSLPVGP